MARSVQVPPGFAAAMVHPTQPQATERAYRALLALSDPPDLAGKRRYRYRYPGDATRQDALDGLSDEERAQLLHMLTTMKQNLLKACERPVEEQKSPVEA